MPGDRLTANRRGNTRGQHSFAQIPSANIQRSVLNRSCGHKTTFDAGYLVPIFTDEVLPGDTMKMKMSSLCRLLTPVKPVMDNIFMDFFFFFVPNRLVWENWQRFCGEEPNPGDSIDFEIPIMDEAVVIGSLSDYFGMPFTGGTAYEHSALYHRAYSLIWREWFRDQNLQDSPVVDLDDGPDDPADYPLRRRGKRHDYFTSALPFVQKGPDVSFLLGTTAPVVSAGTGVPTFNVGTQVNSPLQNRASVSETHWAGAAGIPVTDAVWNTPNLQANLSGATAATINALREAVTVQQFLEKSARGGTRYVELIKSMFGVTSEDQRLQRPEYIGGGTTRVHVHPVARTTPIGASAGQSVDAELGGYGVQMADGIGFNKSFTEHGMIIGLANVRADLTYQYGLDRRFSRSTRFDFYWPQFANLGEQAVLNKEIFLQDSAADDEVFGYQERWAEYRYKPSFVTGRMRSNAGTSLHVWHLAQEFIVLPELNEQFIQDDPPIDRVVFVPSEPHFLGDFFFDYRCARPMPIYSVPGLDRL